MVLEERDAAKVGCEGSVIPMNVYECDCYAREVFEDRLRIGTTVRAFGVKHRLRDTDESGCAHRHWGMCFHAED